MLKPYFGKLKGTTVVGLGFQVLVVGGRKSDGQPTDKMYSYDGVGKGGWSRFEAELPTPTADICTAFVFNNQFLVVVGDQVSGSLDLYTGIWRDFQESDPQPYDPFNLFMPVPKVICLLVMYVQTKNTFILV